jgi:hypothetical protein
MWSGPIHDKAFVSEALKHVEENPSKYGTSPRMRGMLTVASEVRICLVLLGIVTHAMLGTRRAILLYAFETVEFLPLQLAPVGTRCVSRSSILLRQD